MKEYSLKAQAREDKGKFASKTLRKQDLIPAVLYGGEKNINIVVSQREVRDLIYTPDIFLVNLDIDGEVHRCVLQELQFHPVTDRVIHLDFLEVQEDKPVMIQVPVQLDGHAIGVRAGGKLQQDIRKLKVKGLYQDIPERLHIDISKLQLGKVLKVNELDFENLEILTPKNAVVAAVRSSRVAVAIEEDELEDEGEAGEEKAEGADAAEEKPAE